MAHPFTTTKAIHNKLQEMSLSVDGMMPLIDMSDLTAQIKLDRLLVEIHLEILQDLSFAQIYKNWVKLTETGMKAQTVETEQLEELVSILKQ